MTTASFFSNSRGVNAQGAIINAIGGNQVNNQYILADRDEEFKYLRGVCVTSALYDSSSCSSLPCEDGTRTAVLAEISKWALEADSPVCLLYGKAGYGKSAIAQSVCAKHARAQVEPSTLTDIRKLAASFFFNRQEKALDRVITTIAYQLSDFSPALRTHICNVIKQKNTILTALPEIQLEKLIIQPMQAIAKTETNSWIVVIDALDECEDITRMVKLIKSLAKCLRCFITSRSTPDIQPLHEPTTKKLDLEDFPADYDIGVFLKRRLEVIPSMRPQVMSTVSPSSWPSSHDLKSLVTRSSGLFIYASTVVKFIEDKYNSPIQRLAEVLKRGPALTDLYDLYGQVLSAASHDIELVRSVIGAIVFLRVPLSPRALAYLLEIDYSELQVLFEKLHSILSIPGDFDTRPVATSHSSLYDFLTSNYSVYSINDTSLKEADLAKCCLRRITIMPKFTVIFRPSQCASAAIEHWNAQDVANRAATRYACRYWASHLRESSHSRKDLMDGMIIFSRGFVLPWCIVLDICSQSHEDTMQTAETQREMERERGWTEQQARVKAQAQAKAQAKAQARARAWAFLRTASGKVLEIAMQAMEVLKIMLIVAGVVTGLLALVSAPFFMLAKVIHNHTLDQVLDGLSKVMAVPVLMLAFAFVFVLVTIPVAVVTLVVITVLTLFFSAIRNMFAKRPLPKDVVHHDIERCILQAKPWLDKMPVVWRCFFNWTLATAQKEQQKWSADIPETPSLQTLPGPQIV